MASKTQKITGYGLLWLGIIIILTAVYNMFKVCRGAGNPPALFELKDVFLSLPAQGGLSNAKIMLFSGEDAGKMVNMVVFYMFMVFLLSAGSKLSGIGVQLLREIKIAVKNQGTNP